MDRLPPTDQTQPGPQALGTAKRKSRPTVTQLTWLTRGLDQAGGKLPLFDHYGQRYDARTIRSCIDQGWAEPWFKNPIKPDWLVCRLTSEGRAIAEAGEALTGSDQDEDGPAEREARVRDMLDDLFV